MTPRSLSSFYITEFLSVGISFALSARALRYSKLSLLFFDEFVLGSVERYELPNLGALNFLLYKALDGGGTLSLRIDAQGKTMSAALLTMEIDVSEAELAG